MREIWIGLQCASLQQLHSQPRRRSKKHNLVIFAVHNQNGHVNRAKIVGKVSLREYFDAIMLRPDAAHHGLTLPIPRDSSPDLALG